MKKLRMIPLAALLCCLLAATASADETVDGLLARVELPCLFGAQTFDVDGAGYQRILIPRYVRDRYAENDAAPAPGQSDPLVEQVKKTLNSDEIYPKNELVTYTQVRPEVST